MTKAITSAVKPKAPKGKAAAKPAAPKGKGKADASKAKGKGKPAAKPNAGRADAANTVDKALSLKAGGCKVEVTPVQGRGGNRITIDGVGVCTVLRAIGKAGGNAAAARSVLDTFKVGEHIGSSTIGCQVYGHEARGSANDEPLPAGLAKVVKAAVKAN